MSALRSVSYNVTYQVICGKLIEHSLEKEGEKGK